MNFRVNNQENLEPGIYPAAAMHTLIFKFADSISMGEVEQTLQLSLIAAESLHGATRLQLSQCYTLDVPARRCVIDESSDVGNALAVIFAGYVTREFGTPAVKVERERRCGANHHGEVSR